MTITDSQQRGLAVMAFDDTDAPPDTVDQGKRLRNCDKCNADMKLLGRLPALSIHAAIRVFRCYACNHVISEQG